MIIPIKISFHLLKQHTSESSLNWHGLTWIGGTFESDTGGTFHSDMPGTFQSAADGTFVSAIDGTFQSDMSGTFGPLLSPDSWKNGQNSLFLSWKSGKNYAFCLGKTDVICLNERDRNINFGSIYENAVAQE